MTDLLGRLDAAINGTCPCGAEPRETSAYCSDDCTPSWGIANPAGSSAMRWRPDLVTAVDNDGLTSLGSCTFYAGRFSAHLYERDQRTWHLRLDDGNRFVGVDLNEVPDVLDDVFLTRLADLWARLERELTDTRRQVPDDDPWADVAERWDRITESGLIPEPARNAICDWLETNGIDATDVPMNATIRIDGDMIITPMRVRDAAGHPQLDPEDRRTLLTEERTFPLIVPLPADLHGTPTFDVAVPAAAI